MVESFSLLRIVSSKRVSSSHPKARGSFFPRIFSSLACAFFPPLPLASWQIEKNRLFKTEREKKKIRSKGFSVIGTYRSGIGDRGGSMKGKGPHEGGGHLVVYRTPSWYYLGARHARHSLQRLLLGGMILTNRQTDYNAFSTVRKTTILDCIIGSYDWFLFELRNSLDLEYLQVHRCSSHEYIYRKFWQVFLNLHLRIESRVRRSRTTTNNNRLCVIINARRNTLCSKIENSTRRIEEEIHQFVRWSLVYAARINRPV